MTSVFHLYLLMSSYIPKIFRKGVMKNIPMLIRDGHAVRIAFC